MVAAGAVHRSTHGIDHQAARERFALDARMHLQFRIERRFAAAVSHQLDALQQSTSTHIPHERMVAKSLLETAREVRPLRPYILQEMVAVHYPLNGQSCAAGEGVTHVDITVLE